MTTKRPLRRPGFTATPQLRLILIIVRSNCAPLSNRGRNHALVSDVLRRADRPFGRRLPRLRRGGRGPGTGRPGRADHRRRHAHPAPGGRRPGQRQRHHCRGHREQSGHRHQGPDPVRAGRQRPHQPRPLLGRPLGRGSRRQLRLHHSRHGRQPGPDHPGRRARAGRLRLRRPERRTGRLQRPRPGQVGRDPARPGLGPLRLGRHRRRGQLHLQGPVRLYRQR
ncbi:hypothetical protein D3C71_620640 [compost metagenome]